MALLEYNMTAVGLSAIERAFRSIEGYAIAHNRKMQQLFGAGHSLGGIAANDPGSRVAGRAAGGASLERQLAKETAAFEKESQKWRNIQKRSADFQIKETLRAEREKTREVEREAKKRERMLESEAKAEIRAQQRAESHRKGLIRGAIRGGLGGAASMLGSIGAAGMGLVGLGGAAIVANATHGGMKIEAAAGGLANQMVDAGADAKAIAAQKRDIIATAAGVRGASTMDAIGAARSFGGISGNYKLGLRMAQDFSKISLATDVSMEDLSRLAGNAYMKLKTPGMSEDEARKLTLEAVRTFAGQGNIGAVEIKDLAEYGGRLTAAAGQFKGSRVENMAKMGTLAQVAVGSGSATDAAEATMAAARFASDLVEHASDVGKLKVGGKLISPYTDKSKTQFRSIDTLVADIMEGTGGNMDKMKSIFGERSYKMAQGFQQIYLDAERNQKGTGRQAVMDKFDEFMKSAVSEKDVETRAAARLNDADQQLAAAMKELNTAISKEVLPAFTAMLPTIKDMVPIVADLLSYTKFLLEAFKGVAEYLGKTFGTKTSHDEQVKSAIAVANEGLMSPYGRLRSAKSRLETAKRENAEQSFGETIASIFGGEDSPSLRRVRQAEKDIKEAEAEVKEYEKNSERLKANTDQMKTLGDILQKSMNGGGGGGGGVVPPRGANGTPGQPESSEFYNY